MSTKLDRPKIECSLTKLVDLVKKKRVKVDSEYQRRIQELQREWDQQAASLKREEETLEGCI